MAISKLEPEFPYAATLLIYVVLERCLKLHLLEYRKSLTESEVDLEKKVGPKNKTIEISLRDARKLEEPEFIQQYLIYCTLGTLEIIYRVRDNKYSKFRNEVFHSNLYLSDQLKSDYQLRVEENRKYLKTAKEHLIEASEQFFHRKIIESKGLLEFEGTQSGGVE